MILRRLSEAQARALLAELEAGLPLTHREPEVLEVASPDLEASTLALLALAERIFPGGKPCS